MLEFIQGRVTAPGVPGWESSHPLVTHLLHTLEPVGTERVWDICSGASGVTLQSDVRGLHLPEATIYRSESPSMHGAIEHGYRVGVRECYLPLEIWQDGTQAWLALYRRFWADMDWRRIAWWRVTNPLSGEWRRLPIRLRADGQQAFPQAPEMCGWADFAVYADAVQPFWQGQERSVTWGAASKLTMFSGNNINITKSGDIGSMTVTNSGDEAAPLRITITGPWDSGLSINIDGQVIALSRQVSDGEAIVLDTDPSRPGVYTPTGENVTRGWVTRFELATAPAGQTTPIILSGNGTGTVKVAITPLYDDAFPIEREEAAKHA